MHIPRCPRHNEEEINAIETLQNNYDSFSYGMYLTTESFLNDKGEVSGYAALTCDWLTGLFGIPLKLRMGEYIKLFTKNIITIIIKIMK
jgi:hypothetical protein